MKRISINKRFFGIFLCAGICLNAYSTKETAEKIGWVSDPHTVCQGYYRDVPIAWSKTDETILKWKGKGLFVNDGQSSLLGGVTLISKDAELRAARVDIFRTPEEPSRDRVDLLGNVQLFQPDLMVFSNRAKYFPKTKHYFLYDSDYRFVVQNEMEPSIIPNKEKVKLIANGTAKRVSHEEADIRELTDASFSTCPPDRESAWRLYGKHITLNRKTGRGEAKNVVLKVKSVPILYTPYMNFPIDRRRQSGFLLPSIGFSTKIGFYTRVPYYFNIAPNYDFLFTPSFYSVRGMEASGLYRYLTKQSMGDVNLSIVPMDRHYRSEHIGKSGFRYGGKWHHQTVFNPNWSWKVDYQRVSDDYFIKDFASYSEDSTLNQLLQQTEVQFQNPNWQVGLRAEAYQTLQPQGTQLVSRQYKRLPQLIASGDYPGNALGVAYGVHTEAVRFVGFESNQVEGARFHIEPKISYPLNYIYGDFVPAVRLAMTHYDLHTRGTDAHSNLHRTVPIVDAEGRLYLERNTEWLGKNYHHTLEPQLYYLYVPYRDQNALPVFDTTLNTVGFDQLFSPNRFSGLDRIGDTNQISMGLTTRLLEDESGSEKIRFSMGQIYYFANRRVTLDGQDSPENLRKWSPLATKLSYQIDEDWNVSAETSWLLPARELSTMNVRFHYATPKYGIWNVGYEFVRRDKPEEHLYLTDVAAAYPINSEWSVVGRWTQDWNKKHFQNLVYGIQYDACCYAVRFVGGRTLRDFNATSDPQYNKEIYLQISFKGLGHISSGTDALLSNIIGFDAKTLR